MARVRCYLVSGVVSIICPVSAYDFEGYINDIIAYTQGNDDYELFVEDEFLSSFTLFRYYYLNGSKIGIVNYRLDENELSNYKKNGFIPELFVSYDANTHDLINMEYFD